MLRLPSNFILTFLIVLLTFAACRTLEEIPEEPEAEEPVAEAEFVPEEKSELAAKREFRGVWVATVANIDWPSAPGLPVEQQKEEMIDLLNRAAALHFNAIIFQVRPAADAFYDSLYEPWSYYLTGTMGQAPLPAYDPLEFAIREAHKRGMELHAWFNPYRAGHPTMKSEVSPDHISQVNPEFVHQYGDFLWLDPGNPEAKEHTIRVILDVVERYDIDGVHFDDYFYPYPSYAAGNDFPDSLSWQRANEAGNTLSRADWRRNNVNELMKELSERIKEAKPHVKFGISPFGIWRPGYPENTTGFDAYEQLYADARLWLKEGWVDYMTPQIYYRIHQISQPFPVMLQWWIDQNKHERHIWPGLFTSRLRTTDVTWPVDEIIGQVYTSRAFPEVDGKIHFSMRTFLENSGNINRIIAAGPHAKSSLIPATHWLDIAEPGKPEFTVTDYGSHITLRMAPVKPDDDVRWWVLKSEYKDYHEIEVLSGSRINISLYGGEAMPRPEKFAISAVNRAGMEGPAVTVELDLKEEHDTLIDISDRLIPRNEWAASKPGGVEANAIRRNLTRNDTLRFQDLTLVVSQMMRTATVPGHLLKGQFDEEEEVVETESVYVKLYRNGVSESKSIQQGEAFNWYGYHIGLLNINFENRLAQFEIATVASLPVDRAAFLKTGNASNRLRVPHRINKITLHHTGSREPLRPEDDPIAALNGLYDWGAREQNWWDLPYHYLIDLDGNIYEGRNTAYAGETNTSYDPRGHLLISLIGNYNLQEPTPQQLESAAKLMAHSIQKYGLSKDVIYGHDDWADSTCPGSYVRPFLDDGTILDMIEKWLE